MNRRLEKISQSSLRDQIVRIIRDAIIRGQFKPGEKIPEQELAEQLGVSRTPIREAIRILEEHELVVTRPKNGTYIAKIDWAEVTDSLHVRASLEELAVRLGIERLSPDQWNQLCDQLRDLLDGMHQAVGRLDPISATELDMQWHTVLIDAPHNSFLSRTWRKLGMFYLIWSPEREMYPFDRDKWVVSVSRHQELLTALRGRNPDTCVEAVRTHILEKLSDINIT